MISSSVAETPVIVISNSPELTGPDDHNPGHVQFQYKLVLLACKGIQKHKIAMYTKGVDKQT